jgi:precorrin-6x reductase
MADVLVIAGTADARQIIAALTKLKIKVAATVTTSLGNEFLQPYDHLTVYEGGLDAVAMAALIKNTQPACLVDASHPFALAASANASRACHLTGLTYLRFERAPTPVRGLMAVRVPDFKSAAGRLREMPGNILLAIGSRQLEIFTRDIPDFKDRLFVRVLPTSQILAECERLGLSAKNILAIKGPFSEEMNVEMLKYCQAQVMVTKDSGEIGGTLEKLRAANRLAVPALLIDRPPIPYGTRTAEIPEIIKLVQACINGRDLNQGACP